MWRCVVQSEPDVANVLSDQAEADSRGSHSAAARSSSQQPHGAAGDRDSASNSGPNSVPSGGDGGRSSVRSNAGSSSQPNDGEGEIQAEPVPDSPRTPLLPGVTRIGRVQVNCLTGSWLLTGPCTALWVAGTSPGCRLPNEPRVLFLPCACLIAMAGLFWQAAVRDHR